MVIKKVKPVLKVQVSISHGVMSYYGNCFDSDLDLIVAKKVK